MSEIKKHLQSDVKAPKGAKIGIVVSNYNHEITDALLDSCKKELAKRGILAKNLSSIKVPGAFELPLACQQMAESKKYDAVIALGCIIKGETPHFDFIANAVAHGIMDVSLKYKLSVVFGVLTTENLKQAKDRIKGGTNGDKGVEAALTALKMIQIKF